MARAAIVGAGLMGTAMAWPLRDNNHEVRLVGTHLDADIIRSCKESNFHPRLKRQLPDGVRPYYVEDIAEALEGAEIIVSGVSSPGVHWIGQTLGPLLKPGQRILAVTKGLEGDESGDLHILPDVLAAELPDSIRDQVSHAAIGGPCIAGELAGRRQTCVIFGCRQGEVARELAAIFRTDYYHVWATADLVGLEVGVALKNAYTLGVGLAAGFLEAQGGVDEAGAHMFNLAAATFAQSTTEIERLLQIMGGSRDFAYGLPGAGDLYVTAMGGRTVRLGGLLGQGHTYTKARQIMAGETLESAEIIRNMGRAIPGMMERGVISQDDLPLLRALVDVIVHGKVALPPLDSYFHDAPTLLH
jgi:glycerol-3-phosphate dehydrogenase (NAD(P)+)